MMYKYLKNNDYLLKDESIALEKDQLEDKNKQLEVLSSLIVNLIGVTIAEFEQEMEGK